MLTRKISPWVYPGIDTAPGDVDVANFLSSIAANYSLKVADILSPSRKQQLVEVRQVVWYILYHQEKKNYTRIGRMFKRDHATILYGVKKVESLRAIGDFQISNHYKTISTIYKNIRRYGETKND